MFEAGIYRKLVLVFLAIVAVVQVLKLYHIFAVRSQPPAGAIRDLTWGDINFLHTTDTHGWYSGHLNQKSYNANWGDFISFATRLKQIAAANGQDLLLVDSGDRHDGNGLSDITIPNGIASTPIFIQQDYDILTIGNHELYVWENSVQEYETVVPHFKEKYVCSNVEFKLPNGTFVPFGQKYRFFQTPNQKLNVLTFGFLFDFNRNNDGTKVTSIKDVVDNESWFQEALESHPPEKVDLIVVVGHVPISHKWPELFYLHEKLREKYPETKIQYFGGHSHIRDFTVFDEKSTALQSGRYCETVGWASINMKDDNVRNIRERYSRSYIDFNLNSFLHHANFTDNKDQFDTEKGLEVSTLIKKTRKKLELNRPLGYVNDNYYVDYVPVWDKKNIFNLLTTKILTTLQPENSNITVAEERIIIINTGSIRYDLYKGPYTIDTQYIVSPFENQWHKLSLPKSVAVKVGRKLNENSYILANTEQGMKQIDNRQLAPPHQLLMPYEELLSMEKRQDIFKYPIALNNDDKIAIESKHRAKLPKGYVTYDDFGHDGDDTPHKAVVNYPVPNVVESKQLNKSTSGDTIIDLVFYDFITPNILWALKELNYHITESSEFYSNQYLGLLMNEYVKESGI
ncbi:Metallo-dependent phosphatase-like protein [Scheffersomyces xylosifermentans]|uniref:Metallo-dependent phosphatase-like protein n=1 Tax=Scheffersomyces xylosifermentans TaxID=1304137 RepID=UPI00315DA644